MIRTSFVVLALIATLAFLAPPRSAAAPRDGALEEAMEGLKGNLKDLSKSLADPARTEESLASIAEMQRLALAAKLEAPANLELIAEADRDAHRLAFRKDMNALAMMLLEIEADILDGASAAAMDKIEGSLYQLREDSHQRYRKPRER